MNVTSSWELGATLQRYFHTNYVIVHICPQIIMWMECCLCVFRSTWHWEHHCRSWSRILASLKMDCCEHPHRGACILFLSFQFSNFMKFTWHLSFSHCCFAFLPKEGALLFCITCLHDHCNSFAVMILTWLHQNAGGSWSMAEPHWWPGDQREAP